MSSWFQREKQAIRAGSYSNEFLEPSHTGYGSRCFGKDLSSSGIYSLSVGECDKTSTQTNSAFGGEFIGVLFENSSLEQKGLYSSVRGDLKDSSTVMISARSSLTMLEINKSKVENKGFGNITSIEGKGDANLNLNGAQGSILLTDGRAVLSGSGHKYSLNLNNSLFVVEGANNQLFAVTCDSKTEVLGRGNYVSLFATNSSILSIKAENSLSLITSQKSKTNITGQTHLSCVYLNGEAEFIAGGIATFTCGVENLVNEGIANAVIGFNITSRTNASLTVGFGCENKPALPSLILAGGSNQTAGFQVESTGPEPKISASASIFEAKTSGFKEVFEWREEPFEDPIGLFVELKEGKLVIADTTPIGVVTGRSGFIAGAYQLAYVNELGTYLEKEDYVYSLNLYLLSKRLPKEKVSLTKRQIIEKYQKKCPDIEDYLFPVAINDVDSNKIDPTAISKKRQGSPVTLVGRVRVKSHEEIKTWRVSCQHGYAIPGNDYVVVAHVSSHVVEIVLR